MKKTGYSYSLQAIILALALMTSLASCLSDDLLKETEERGLMVLSLKGVQTRAAGDPLLTGDEEITKVRIFVFAGETLEVNRLFQTGEETFNNPFILDVITGNKDVYVVANESPILATELSSVTTKAGLFDVLSDEIAAPLALPLPMTGYVLNVPVIEQPDPAVRNEVQVTLTRVAAKISLQFKKASENDEVKITKISLLSNTGKTTLFPVPPATAVSPQSYWDFTTTLDNPLELLTALSPVNEIGDIYVYENITEGIKTNATQLEVEALFNDVITTYRVYINENIATPGTGTPGDPSSSSTTPGDHPYSIKRGYHYKLNGTIVNMGAYSSLLLDTEVLPWNLLQSTFNYEYVNAVFQVAPKPPVGSPVKITSPTANINLNFKIIAPVGRVWSVSLTNTADFVLIKDAATNAYTWGTIGGGSGSWPDIRIALRPGVTVSPGASTEVIVRVNGVEIDFDKSGTTGPGNRLVVIYQP
ncbi:MAG TPA: hypothetical protein DDZ57_09225 [Porphyromonadaceae bacterium]|jgi:hypothetical protein|nr:hypothetical protein [Porphyromonadaceae bacterium]